MKKTWMTAGLAALLVLPLAGCTGDQPDSGATPSAAPTETGPSPMISLDPEDGRDDLAGADGIVGDDDAGDHNPGQADDPPPETGPSRAYGRT